MKLLVIAALLAVIFLTPFVTIAALNALFGLGIPLTIWTYLSTLWLTMLVAGTSRGK